MSTATASHRRGAHEGIRSMTIIYERLTRIFRDVLDEPSLVLTPEMSAGDVASWDSVNHVNLIVSIEAEFHCRFTIAELEALRSVDDIAELIQKKTR
jgi:acyl carrier protein